MPKHTSQDGLERANQTSLQGVVGVESSAPTLQVRGTTESMVDMTGVRFAPEQRVGSPAGTRQHRPSGVIRLRDTRLESASRIRWHQIGCMLGKNMKLKLRNLRGTAKELAFPVYTFALLVLLRVSVRVLSEGSASSLPAEEALPSSDALPTARECASEPSGCILQYYPDNGVARRLSAQTVAQMGAESWLKINGYEKIEDMEADFLLKPGKVVGALEFENDHCLSTSELDPSASNFPALACDLQYTIRINGSFLALLPSMAWTEQTQINAGIGTLQWAVDRAIAQEIAPVAHRQVVLKLQEFTTSTGGNSRSMSLFGALYVVLAFVPTIQVLITNIVKEKASRTKQGMKAMGLQSGVFWVSWLLSESLFTVGVTIIMVIVAIFSGLFGGSDASLVLFTFVLYVSSTIALAFMVSTFFDSPRTAGPFMFSLLTITSGLFIILRLVNAPRAVLWPFSLLSPFAMGLAGEIIWNGNAKWNFVASGPIPILGLCFMLCLDGLMYLGLTWYFDQIIPSSNGTSRPLLFPIDSLIARIRGLNIVRRKFKQKVLPGQDEDSGPSETDSSETCSDDASDGMFSEGEAGASNSYELHDSTNMNCVYEPLSPGETASVALRVRGMRCVYGEGIGIRLSSIFKSPFAQRPNTHRRASIRPLLKKRQAFFKLGSHVAVENIDLDIVEGQITVLLGPNGSGKSSLLNAIAGVLQPNSGGIFLHGVWTEVNANILHFNMGFCPQDDSLVAWPVLSVKEHVRFFAQLKSSGKHSNVSLDNFVQDALSMAGVLPHQFNTPIHRLLPDAQRRVSVAIAFVCCPSVLILDEPTAGLSSEDASRIWKALRHFAGRGATVVVSTHNLAEAEHVADRIGVMVAGSLRAMGSPKYLKQRFGAGHRLQLSLLASGSEVISDDFLNKNHSSEIARACLKVVQKHFPHSQLVSSEAAMASYTLPNDSKGSQPSAAMSALLGELESRREELGIDTYALKSTSLEQIFLKLAQGDDNMALIPEPRDIKAAGYENTEMRNALTPDHVHTDTSISVDSNNPESQHSIDQLMQNSNFRLNHKGTLQQLLIKPFAQMLVIIAHRSCAAYRDRRLLAYVIGFPLVVFGASLAMGRFDIPGLGAEAPGPYAVMSWHDQETVPIYHPPFSESQDMMAAVSVIKNLASPANVRLFASEDDFILYLRAPLIVPHLDETNTIPQAATTAGEEEQVYDERQLAVMRLAQEDGLSSAGGLKIFEFDTLKFELNLDATIVYNDTYPHSSQRLLSLVSNALIQLQVDQHRTVNSTGSDNSGAVPSQTTTVHSNLTGTTAIPAHTTASISQPSSDTLEEHKNPILSDDSSVDTARNLFGSRRRLLGNADDESFPFSSVRARPLPFRPFYVDTRSLLLAVGVVTAISYPLPFIVEGFVRGSRSYSRHLMFLAGVRQFVFWIGAFVADTFFLMAPIALCIALGGITKIGCFAQQYLPVTASVMLLYASAGAAMCPVLSRAFVNPDAVLRYLPIVLFSATMVPFCIVAPMIEFFPNVLSAFNWVAGLFPPYALVWAIFTLNTRAIYDTDAAVTDVRSLVLAEILQLSCTTGALLCFSFWAQYRQEADPPPLNNTFKQKHLLVHRRLQSKGQDVRRMQRLVLSQVRNIVQSAGNLNRESQRRQNLQVMDHTRRTTNSEQNTNCGEDQPSSSIHARTDDSCMTATAGPTHLPQAISSDFETPAFGLLVQMITKSFASGNKIGRVLDEVSLAVRPKECLGILGPNGAGKSSLVGVIAGLITPDDGSVFVAGRPMHGSKSMISKLTGNETGRQQLGICLQHDALTESMTVKEHLMLTIRLNCGSACVGSRMRNSAAAMLASFGISQSADTPVNRLSKADGRKLSICMAMINRPHVLVLDEPTTGLDPKSRRLIWDNIKSYSKHAAVLLCTHSMEEAEACCTSIGILVDGSIRCIDDPSSLKKRFGRSYSVSLFVDQHGETTAEQMFTTKFPSAKLVDASCAKRVYLLPTTVSILSIFKTLEAFERDAVVTSFLVGETSLEDVFLRITQQYDYSMGHATTVAGSGAAPSGAAPSGASPRPPDSPSSGAQPHNFAIV